MIQTVLTFVNSSLYRKLMATTKTRRMLWFVEMNATSDEGILFVV